MLLKKSILILMICDRIEPSSDLLQLENRSCTPGSDRGILSLQATPPPGTLFQQYRFKGSLASRCHRPLFGVRKTLDSGHEVDRLVELRLVPIAYRCSATKMATNADSLYSYCDCLSVAAQAGQRPD